MKKKREEKNAKRKNEIQRRKRAITTRSFGALARAAPSGNGALRQAAIFPHSKFRENLAQPSSIPFCFPSFHSLPLLRIKIVSQQDELQDVADLPAITPTPGLIDPGIEKKSLEFPRAESSSNMASFGHAYPNVARSNRNKPRKARAVKQKNMDTPARRGANDVQNGVQGTLNISTFSVLVVK
ncbi:hypothetical protein WN51_05118 [Melipona quadrifasciata]|uniref:Uncharacterized protein n=1 Tax=Melipona quadrifasciata TaxID=166423 RepID=A0A0N0BD43_9HYME|nr:hypothetical protein WN51_05118 [Melipona quadrifasciata]